jgi:hypothetical protein
VELEAPQLIAAVRCERTGERRTYRHGHRERSWETSVGKIPPRRIAKVHDATCFPSPLEHPRRSEKALLAVIHRACVEGVSNGRMDFLLQAMGLTGINNRSEPRLCKELDEMVEQFGNRPPEGTSPIVWLDALYQKVRHHHQIISQAFVIAAGVRETCERELRKTEIGPGASPVASSRAASKHGFGPPSSSHSCWLATICTSTPHRGERSRQRRRRGGRRLRGLARPAWLQMQRALDRDNPIPWTSSSTSVRWWSL